jgi:hypothetical protein
MPVREAHSHRALTPSPSPLRVAKTGKNHLNEESTPLLPTGIGERFSQTIENLGHAALLRRCELPLNENAELTRGALYPVVNSLL